MGIATIVRLGGRFVFGLCLLAVGGLLTYGGVKLIGLGGSFYYLPAGLAAVACGIAVLLGRWRLGAAVYLVLVAASLVWGISEAGLDGWGLAPRVLAPAVLGLPFLFVALLAGTRGGRRLGLASVGLAAVVVLAVWANSGYRPVPAGPGSASPVAAAGDGDWLHFGNTEKGTHFSPLAGIGPGNVAKLERVWSLPVGPLPAGPISVTQTVPLKVGDDLFACAPSGDIYDIVPESGKLRWVHHAKGDYTGIYVARCRGVAYYAVPDATGTCAKRVYIARTDGSLDAVDAESGELCQGFGAGGHVDLLKGLAQRSRGYYTVTSAPTLVRGKLVIGGSVADGQYVGEPSGVVRAYDAVSGKLAWAWDPGNPDVHGEPTQGYTPDTPNVWGPMSADEALGLVYVPTGNATPDYWGGHRSPDSNRFASSLVAIDAETGQARWSFQTTHYDLWDYDVAAQPVLFELKRGGHTTPAVLQGTKRGELFVLDRRTGKPLFPVVEKPVPQAGAVEKISPTQPFSIAMPEMRGPRLTEKSMWGLTPLDQLWCRIAFREARYDGTMTPPGLTPSLADPGYIGGVDWGGASIDQRRQIAYVLSNRIVNHVQLVPRSDPRAKGLKAAPNAELGGLVAQEGTPYAADIHPFMSPLGVPCQAPPYGLVNAVDLATGRLLWSRPLGSARDLGPMRMPSHLPFTAGTPLFGGPMGTASGLVFAAASQDHAIRAFDGRTGKLLFAADLPGSSSTSPMSFRSTQDGRQYVVIASEAPARDGKAYGAITAFALPKKGD